ncbi:MAG: DUF6371 domain-containing protein [Cyclobacteriaceae bacterium]|nr:DUF6371 domain-containing protein [Cyclobacteriaceae bacterium]
MNEFRYILEPYSGQNSRFSCPKCQKKRSFTRYIDQINSEYLPFEFGKCNRLVKCGYWLDPYKERIWEKDLSNFIFQPVVITKKSENEKPTFHSMDEVKRSLKQYENNSLVTFFASKFGIDNTRYLIQTYLLGTSKKYREKGNGAVIFWNIDINGNVRGGKIIGYDPKTGKRVKNPFVLQNWVHKVNPDYIDKPFNLSHCFFGEHLLRKYPFKPVGLVESEKTALICSLYLPNLVWLATGSLQGISIEKSKSLKGRNIYLFPDLSIDGVAFKKWSQKLEFLKSITKSVQVSDLLERLASGSEKENGFDLADYFLNIPLEEWKKLNRNDFLDNYSAPEIIEEIGFYTFDEIVTGLKLEGKNIINSFGYPATWDTLPSFQGIDSRTKDFILLAQKNPALLELQKRMGLE